MKTLTEITGYYGPLLAKGAFELGAIRLSPSDPFTWASGYRMPIYNDNRQFLAMPKYRALIRDAFADMLSSLGVNPDNIAGTATAGIPHATSLADMLYKPLTYVRSSSKDHGLGHQIEGLGRNGSYEGKNVLQPVRRIIPTLQILAGTAQGLAAAVLHKAGGSLEGFPRFQT